MTVDTGIIAIIVSIIAAIPLYVDLVFRWRRNRLDFELERFQEDSFWNVRVLHPTKAIEHCSVFLDKNPLSLGNTIDRATEVKVPKGGGANFQIPKTLNPFGGVLKESTVTIKDGKKVLRKRKFRDIPAVGLWS